MEESYYHYCSTQTFCSIINAKALRLSSLTLSNDRAEGRYLADLLLKTCEEIGVEGANLATLSREVYKLFSFFSSLGICFSKNGDLLSQWRGYADEAHGVSIGVSAEALAKAKDHDVFKKCPTGLIIIEYREEEQQRLIKPIAKQVVALVKGGALDEIGVGFADRRNADEQAKLRLSFTDQVLSLLPVMFGCKSRAFEEENEVRLLVTYFTREFRGPHNLLTPEFKFFARRNTVVPYVDLPLEGSEAITEIVLGPRNTTPKSVIEDLLQRDFPKATVRLSDSTFR